MVNGLTDYLAKCIIALIIIAVLEKKSELNNARVVLVCIVLILAIIFIGIPVKGTVANFIILILLFIYKKIKSENFLQSSLCGTIFYLYIYLIEGFCYAVFVIFDENITIEMQTVTRILSYFCSLLFYIGIVISFRKLGIALLDVKSVKIPLFIGIEVGSISIILFILNIGYRLLVAGEFSITHRKLMVILLLICIFIIIIGFWLYGMVLYIKQIKKNLHNQKIIINLQKKYFEVLRKQDTELRKFKHDIQKHILVLQSFAASEEIIKIQEYLQELNSRVAKIKKVFSTGNETADLFINALSSQNPQINFQVFGRLPNKISVSQYDFSVIFSNLLENAVEAVERENVEKIIYINLGYYNDYMKIEIVNPSMVKTIKYTSKKDILLHGYGILNIKEALSNYEHKIIMRGNGKEYKVELLIKYTDGQKNS